MDYNLSRYLEDLKATQAANNNFNSQQAQLLNAFNASEAQKARDWSQLMSNTAHQREVQDLKAAGLNPVLSANGGSGAPSFTGSSASGQKADADTSLISGMSNLISSAINSATAIHNAELQANTNLQTSMLGANATKAAASISAAATKYASDNSYNANIYKTDKEVEAELKKTKFNVDASMDLSTKVSAKVRDPLTGSNVQVSTTYGGLKKMLKDGYELAGNVNKLTPKKKK